MPDGITYTEPVNLDADFEVSGEVTKTWVDQRTGNRYVRGVASGVEEDQDGERCSENCVKSMVAQVNRPGAVALTATHDQDWWSEFGEVTKGTHDAETGEFIVEAVLPPEGQDPVADKAWRAVNRRQLGFSVGGKLRRAYFERNQLGKKRKVLDDILLRHIVLTQKPSYAQSFAQAVAKTFDADPVDREFTLTEDDVEKASITLTEVDVEKASTGSWAGSGGANSGRDSAGTGPRNAGTRKPKAKGPSVEDDDVMGGDDDGDEPLPAKPGVPQPAGQQLPPGQQPDVPGQPPQDGDQPPGQPPPPGQEPDLPPRELPKAQGDERHLACPNCGHEFAADLPSEDDQQPDDNADEEEEAQNRASRDLNNAETGKTTEKFTMPAALTDTLDELRGLVAEAEKPPEQPVEKTVTEDNEVAKMVAASYRQHEDRFDTVEKQVGQGFELIADAIRSVNERIDQLPAGRQSIAKTTPQHPRGLDGADEVAKTIQDDDDAVTALKKLNAAHPAYAHLG